MQEPKLKRIIFVHHTGILGGSTANLLKIIKYLDRNIYDPVVLLLTDGPAKSLFESKNIEVYIRKNISIYPHCEEGYFHIRSFQPWKPITEWLKIIPSAIRLKKILIELNIDFVFINTSVQLPTIIGSYLAGKKSILYIQEVFRKGTFGFRRYIYQKAIKYSINKLIVISKHNANSIPLEPKKTSIVYQLIDENLFNSSKDIIHFRKEFSLSDNAFVVGFLGGMIRHKGIIVLLKSARKLLKKYDDIFFLIGGPKPKTMLVNHSLKRKIRLALEKLLFIPNTEIEVNNLLNDKFMNEKIIFTGTTKDVSKLIGSSSLVALPGLVSQFGRPLCEAGMMSKAVVSSDFPSHREIIDDGITGLFFKPNDHDDLANKIEILYGDRSLLDSLGENRFNAEDGKYYESKNAKKIIDVIDSLNKNNDVK